MLMSARLVRRVAVASAAVAVGAAAAAATVRRRGRDAEFAGRSPPATSLSLLRLAGASRAAAASSATVSEFQKPRNYREQRFLEFASVEYDGVPYMTPQDFLESVTQDFARHRKRRRALSRQELQQSLYKTPSRWWASSSLFRSLGDDGIISYPEYLFLLCILAKPKAGFEIAFKMLDRARNQRVDKEEFMVLNRMMLRDEAAPDGEGQDTTLTLHLFGRSGREKLDFQEFAKFMTNLQTEVLEIEFTEFSKGLRSISESEFARILLRYTNLSKESQDAYVQRTKDKLVCEQGIQFEDFRLFFQFLNHLDDFTMAMKMYSMAGHSISQEEFQRAVKACVGYTLAPHVVSTVFLLFDKDDDGHLSYQEFLSILRDRLRGLSSKPVSADTTYEKFKRCVGQQIKEETA